MSPVLLALFTGLAVALPVVASIAVVVAPVASKLLAAHVDEKTMATIRTYTNDAYVVISAIAATTKGTTLDDDVAAIVKVVNDNFAAVKGRQLTTAEKIMVQTQVVAMHVTPALPNLGHGAVKASLIQTSSASPAK